MRTLRQYTDIKTPLILKMVTSFLKYVHPKILLTMKNKEKKFDAVKLMREIREKVNKEIANLTPEQVVEYFRIHREKYDQEMASK